MNLELLYSRFLLSDGINTDTRSLKSGQMFWALKGPNFNGNGFVRLALESGAAFVVCDEDTDLEDDRILRVEDGLSALQQLARHHRQIWGKKVIAVCGSNGKTTTKELITKALSVDKTVFATPGNLNNHIGVPLSILQIRPEHDIAILEMGANHPGEIAELCQIAEPTSGLITNVGKDHLEGFGSIEGSAEANAELFDFLETRGGIAFINTFDEWNLKLRSRVRKNFTYPASTDNLSCQSLKSGFYLILRLEGSEPVETQLTGQYNFHNMACALTVAKYYKVNMDKALHAVASYAPSNNRSQVLRTTHNVVISDAYNANPSSMLAALENLIQIKADRKIAILGDMLELGADSETEHFELGAWASRQSDIHFLVTGTEMAAFARAFPKAIYFQNKADLEDFIKKESISNATVLLKGSRGMKLESLIPVL